MEMKKWLSKLVRLSKPMKVADENKDTSLPSYIINYSYELWGLRRQTHQVDKMSVDEMSVDKMPVDEMPVNEMSVDEMSVDEMSVDEMSVDEMAWRRENLWAIKVED